MREEVAGCGLWFIRGCGEIFDALLYFLAEALEARQRTL